MKFVWGLSDYIFKITDLLPLDFLGKIKHFFDLQWLLIKCCRYSELRVGSMKSLYCCVAYHSAQSLHWIALCCCFQWNRCIVVLHIVQHNRCIGLRCVVVFSEIVALLCCIAFGPIVLWRIWEVFGVELSVAVVRNLLQRKTARMVS